MNHVNLIGEVCNTSNDKEFILTTKEMFIDTTGELIKQSFQHTIFTKSEMWSKIIENLKQGDKVAIEGKLICGEVLINDMILL